MPIHKQLTAVISLQFFCSSEKDFEKRMNALRRQFSAERIQITKDAYRQIGHINNAISATSFPEVRDALRAEKARVYEAMRTSHRYNRICYMQQLEALEDEYNIHLEKNPSKIQVRRMMTAICRFVESAGGQFLYRSFRRQSPSHCLFLLIIHNPNL